MSETGFVWAVGVTTAPRKEPTLDICLDSLDRSGWERPRLFAEPDTLVPSGLPVTRRDEVIGAFANWYLGLAEMVMRQPHADAYFICQDDAIFASGMRPYLERTLWPASEVGVASVYCPSHEHREASSGFRRIDPGWDAWGALGYIFSNISARRLLANQLVLDHRHHGPAGGRRNIDSVVGAWCRREQLPYFVHVPSLAQHIGHTSTIWKNGRVAGRRMASDFLGNAERLGDDRINE